METVLTVLLTLAVLAAFLAWFRGYLPGVRRGYAQLRGFWRLWRQLRGSGQPRAGQGQPRPPAGRTIDVEPLSSPAQRERCKVCGDSLSSAQLLALRQNDIRCVGSSRVGKPCPYRKYN